MCGIFVYLEHGWMRTPGAVRLSVCTHLGACSLKISPLLSLLAQRFHRVSAPAVRGVLSIPVGSELNKPTLLEFSTDFSYTGELPMSWCREQD